jgi:hypothetical protein
VSEYLLVDERAAFCAVISAAVIASDASDFMISPAFVQQCRALRTKVAATKE